MRTKQSRPREQAFPAPGGDSGSSGGGADNGTKRPRAALPPAAAAASAAATPLPLVPQLPTDQVQPQVKVQQPSGDGGASPQRGGSEQVVVALPARGAAAIPVSQADFSDYYGSSGSGDDAAPGDAGSSGSGDSASDGSSGSEGSGGSSGSESDSDADSGSSSSGASEQEESEAADSEPGADSKRETGAQQQEAESQGQEEQAAAADGGGGNTADMRTFWPTVSSQATAQARAVMTACCNDAYAVCAPARPSHPARPLPQTQSV